MKESYKSFDELPMMISVSQVAKVLGISRTRSYELVNEKGFPKIITTRQTGGLHKGYKPLILTRVSRRGLSLCSSLIVLATLAYP